MTSRVQNWMPFWCTALNNSEAGLPPYEAALNMEPTNAKLVGRQMVL